MKKLFAVLLCLVLLGMTSAALAEDVTLVMSANPTTGYDWTFVCDEEIVKVESVFQTAADLGKEINEGEELEAADQEMLVGEGGLYTFTLKGVAPGTALVAFEYLQGEDESTTVVGITYEVVVDENLAVTIIGSTVGVV